MPDSMELEDIRQYSVEDLMQLFGSARDKSNPSNQGCKGPGRCKSNAFDKDLDVKERAVADESFHCDINNNIAADTKKAFMEAKRCMEQYIGFNDGAYEEKSLGSVSQWVEIKSEDDHLFSCTIDQKQTCQEPYEEYANRRLNKTEQAYREIVDPSNNLLRWKLYSEKDACEMSVYNNKSDRENCSQFQSENNIESHFENGYSSFWDNHIWQNVVTRHNEVVLGMFGEQNKLGNKPFFEELISPEITDITDVHSSNECSPLPEKPEVYTQITTDSNIYSYIYKDLVYPNHGTDLKNIRQTFGCMPHMSNALACSPEICNSQWYETNPVYLCSNQSSLSMSSIDSSMSATDDTTKTTIISGRNVTTNTVNSPYNGSFQNTSLYTSSISIRAKADKKLSIRAKADKKPKLGCRLWEFIRNLLLDPATNPSFIRWENRADGLFKLVQSKEIARLWGMKKGNVAMNYEKLSRAMRYYYKRKIFEPVLGKRLVYRFGPVATGWREDE